MPGRFIAPRTPAAILLRLKLSIAVFYWPGQRIALAVCHLAIGGSRALHPCAHTNYGIPTLNQRARPRRQEFFISGDCGIAGIRMDPLAILWRGSMGNDSCDRVCAALSPAGEFDAE